jgi:predicted TIM-barrel fold metal-dependent hydrolase
MKNRLEEGGVHGVDPQRRRVLTGLGAAAAAAAAESLLHPGFALAQAPQYGARRRIDVHHHFLPPAYREEIRDALVASATGSPGFGLVMKWSPQMSLDAMDEFGVAAAVLSISTPGVWFGNVADARRLARECNEYGARMMQDHPGRFGLFAAVPLPDVDGGLAEAVYALDTLHADGIGLLSSYGDKWLGDPAFAPLFDELNRRKAVVFVHPSVANCCGSTLPQVPPALIELLFDTTRTITSLLYSGTLTRCPDIRFVFCHGGGATAQMAQRIAAPARNPAIAAKFPLGVMHEIQKLYVDIADMTSPASHAGVRDTFGAQRILFGSDFPFVPTLAATVGGLGQLKLPAAELRAIERGNALALVPRLASANAIRLSAARAAAR